MAGPSINKVTLLGNLGSDPEVRYTQSGKPVASFSIATTEAGRSTPGQEREARTEWHKVVVWDRLAELCGQYLSKGRQVYVEGRLQTRQWEDRNGQKQYTTEIVAREVLFLGGGAGRDAEAGGRPAGDRPRPAGRPESGGHPDRGEYPARDAGSGRAPQGADIDDVPYGDDDIPF